MVAGLTLFARYAYPPNELGYCGPGDHRALLDYGATGVTDGGLGELARGFTGPWVYLTLVAGAAGIDNPFDARVVEAYWIGNKLLDQVEPLDFTNALHERLRPRSGSSSAGNGLTEAVPSGAAPDHNFHVFEVYPWSGLLGGNHDEKALNVLDRCRIRWGQVVEAHGGQATISYRPLTWDGERLELGEPTTETVTWAHDGLGFVDTLRPGDWVSAHWGWVCDKLDARQLANLRRRTAAQLAATNRSVGQPGLRKALTKA